MNSEGISSLAVVDNQHNVIGNISTWDVKVAQPSIFGRCQFTLLTRDYGAVSYTI